MAASKLVIPLIGLGVAALALLTKSGTAHAAGGSSGGSSGGTTPVTLPNVPGLPPGTSVTLPGVHTGGVPDAVISRMLGALGTGNPATIRAEAARLEADGYTVQAADMRAAATALEQALGKPPTTASPGLPPVPTVPVSPIPISPTLANTRFVTVQKGEGPAAITRRVLGASQEGRWPELVKANSPPKAVAKSGNFQILNPGEKLKVPDSWPNSPHYTLGSGLPVTVPTTSITIPGGVIVPPVTSAPAGAPVRRIVTVLRGEGPSQITARVLGSSQAGRWRELVKANSPPKAVDSKTGSFKILNPGEKLVIPNSWPTIAPHVTLGGDPMAEQSLGAGKVALGLHLKNLSPEVLARWQAQQGIRPSGQYCPDTALVLCYRYTIVPPGAPRVYPGGKRQAENFVSAMRRAARKDPQRSDEYGRVIRETIQGVRL